MKKVIITILLTNCLFTAFCQTEINDIKFCNSESQQLEKSKWGEFNFIFNESPLQFLFTSDSSFFYDAVKKELVIRTNYPKSYVEIKIYNDTLQIKNRLTDSTIFFTNLISIGDYNPYVYFKEQVVQVHYSNYRLIGVSFFFNCDYTINARIFTIKNSAIAWDVQVSDRFYRAVKVYENYDGNVSNIYLCKDKSFTPSIKKPFAGTEIVTNFRKNKALGVSKIRLVKTTNYSGVFSYEDLILYDKKGKLKSSKITFGNCNKKL